MVLFEKLLVADFYGNGWFTTVFTRISLEAYCNMLSADGVPSNLQTEEAPLVGFPPLFIQYISCYPPYLKAVTLI
jgi:hypothetical protein